MLKKISAAVLTAAVFTAMLLTGCGDTSPFANETPYSIYQTVSGKTAALKSIEYSSEQVSKINFAKNDQRKTLTELSSEEVYKDETMDSSMHVSYKGNTSVTEYDVYYRDDTMYSDMTGIRQKEKISLMDLCSGNLAVTNPLLFMKGNLIFSIPEKDIREIDFQEDESQDEKNILSLTLNDDCISTYLMLASDEESAIYTENIEPTEFKIEMVVDDDFMPSEISLKSDVSVSSGKGHISWKYIIESVDSLEKIDFPDLSKYKALKTYD